MSVLVSAFILTIVILAGQQATASQTCQYSYSCTGSSGGCTYKNRTCDDICCDDKTRGYSDICCSSSSNTGTIAGGASGGAAVIIIIIVLWCCCCPTSTKVDNRNV